MTSGMASPLLALPQELRTKIFEELLCPEPARVLTLWHDRHGRPQSLNLHPSILCANKQIYYEAVSLLYNNNKLEISLTTNVVQTASGIYLDGKPDPPPLFQEDVFSAYPRTDGVSAGGLSRLLEIPKETIDIESFIRLRHIKLKTKKAAIWGWTTRGSVGEVFFTHTGHLIMRILNLLSEQIPATSSIPSTFDFQIVSDWRTTDGIFSTMAIGAEVELQVIKILRLLKEIREKRSVLVLECIRPDGFSKLREVEVDIDARLAQASQVAYENT